MDSPGAIGWRWPEITAGGAAKVLLAHLAAGFANASWLVVQARAEHDSMPWAKPYFTELTAVFCLWLLFPLVLAATLNAPRPAGRMGRFLGLHAAAYALYALAAPFLFLGLRHLLHPALGWGRYHYGPWSLLPMEWIKLLIVYAALVAGTAAWLNFRDAQARARREADLAARLQEARLQALAAQLDPHFLFNALNTVSSVMYEDLARTDQLLASLAQMLRDGLEAGDRPWTLAREQRHLEAFLAFAEARFGDRLRVRREVQEDLGDPPVPRFALQRLVENALKHNLDDPQRILQVLIVVRAEGGDLRLEVEDDGAGFAEPSRAFEGEGVGLRNLADALALQYGGRAALEAANLPGGGARVSVRIPRG